MYLYCVALTLTGQAKADPGLPYRPPTEAYLRFLLEGGESPPHGPISLQQVGIVDVPSGSIGVSCPSYFEEPKPLKRKVPPGTWPVFDHFDKRGQPQGHVSVVRFADSPVERFDYEGSAPVSTALLVIYDAEAMANAPLTTREALNDRLAQEPDPQVLPPMVFPQPLNGDGSYPLTWGLDAKGEPVVLIIDHLAAGEDCMEHAVLPMDSSGAADPKHPFLVKHKVRLNSRFKTGDLVVEVRGLDGGSVDLWDPNANRVIQIPHQITHDMQSGIRTIAYRGAARFRGAQLVVEVHDGYGLPDPRCTGRAPR